MSNAVMAWRSLSQAAEKLLIIVLAGQSNQVGYGANRDTATDINYPGIYQYGSATSVPSAPAVDTTIAPLYHNDAVMQLGNAGNTGTTSYLSPGEYMAREAIESGYAHKVLLVPGARGSTPLDSFVDPSWRPGDPAGYQLYEAMITQANAAIAAASSHGDFAGMATEVVFSWVQGEQDATNNVSQATYAADMASLISGLRARITGAGNAKFIIGSMVPNYWLSNGANYDPAMDLINRAHVQASLENADTFYAMGADGNITNNGRHYGTAALIRDQGRRMARIFASPASQGPNITSANTVAATNGSPFSLSLTHDGIHATFAIVGGTDAGLFELSDPYHLPRLRWAGNGNGPTADGNYVVQIAAYDGGPVQTITATVTTAAAPTAVSYEPAAGSPFMATAAAGVANYVLFNNVPFKTGVNLIAIMADNRYVTSVTVNGTAASLVVSSDSNTQYDTVLYQIDMTAAGNFDLRIQVSSSGADICAHVGALPGASPTVASTAVKAIGSVADPATTSTTLTIPANGLCIALGRASGTTPIVWNTGTGIEDAAVSVTQRTTSTDQSSLAKFLPGTVTPSFNDDPGSGEAIAAAVFALA